MSRKTVLITGANGGIGLATAKSLSEEYDLVLTSRSKEGVHFLRRQFPHCKVILLDLNNLDTIETTLFSLGDIDIYGLIHCAGVMNSNMLIFDSHVNLINTFNVNTLGPILVTKFFLKSMMRNKAGSIIFIASAVGKFGAIGKSVYSASKSSLYGLTKSLSKEIGRANIRVNSISPGYVETKLTENMSVDERVNTLQSISLKRCGNIDDVANLVSFLISDRSSYITGDDIQIDGGMVL